MKLANVYLTHTYSIRLLKFIVFNVNITNHKGYIKFMLKYIKMDGIICVSAKCCKGTRKRIACFEERIPF